jgi:2-oxoglutarate ferredoxin oxidoreductase subunit beta
VTFNNHAGSTKSYDYVREHNEAVNRIDFIDAGSPILGTPAPSGVIEVPQPDGSVLRLRKLDAAHDATDRRAAMDHVQALQAHGEIPTGLLFVDARAGELHDALNTVPQALSSLGDDRLCPGAAVLAGINGSLR